MARAFALIFGTIGVCNAMLLALLTAAISRSQLQGSPPQARSQAIAALYCRHRANGLSADEAYRRMLNDPGRWRSGATGSDATQQNRINDAVRRLCPGTSPPPRPL